MQSNNHKEPLAKYEKIQTSFGNSFTYLKFIGREKTNSHQYHFHPEFEMIYVANGRGVRRVGNHSAEYVKGDLIFVGPNIPHMGMAYDIDDDYQEVVIQMKDRFLGNDFFEVREMAQVKNLFERAKTGLVFGEKTKWEISQHLEKFEQADYFSKMTELLVMLQVLAHAKDCTSLNYNSLAVKVNQMDRERMETLNDFLQKNYHRKFTMEEVAGQVNMTVPSLCRFFKNLTHKTFMEYTNEYRIAMATRMLSQKDLSISAISFESGFNNLSHFNKQFRQITGQTPTEYRKNVVNFVAAKLQ